MLLLQIFFSLKLYNFNKNREDSRGKKATSTKYFNLGNKPSVALVSTLRLRHMLPERLNIKIGNAKL